MPVFDRKKLNFHFFNSLFSGIARNCLYLLRSLSLGFRVAVSCRNAIVRCFLQQIAAAGEFSVFDLHSCCMLGNGNPVPESGADPQFWSPTVSFVPPTQLQKEVEEQDVNCLLF